MMSSSSQSYGRVESSASGVTSVDSGSQGVLYPRAKNDSKRNQHNSAYVPHNRFSRYTTALVNLVPIRFKRVPGSELPLDKIGLFSSVSLNWLNEYLAAGCKNGAKDKPMPTIARLDGCQVNGMRIDGLWHTHIVERGQAGASVPRIAWQFVRTRVLVASFIYLLGMIISFCSPIILLRQIISSTVDRLDVYHRHLDAVTRNLTLDENGSNFSNETLSTTKNILATTISSNETTTIMAPTRAIDNKSIIDILPDSISHVIMLDEVIVFSNIGVLILAEIVSYFLIAWSASLNLRTATRLRSACLALAYKKLVRSSIRYEASAYQTMTYFVPSSKILYELIANGPLIFSGPVILLLWSLFMWRAMGHWALIGILVFVILFSCLILTAYLAKVFGTRMMNYSLQRISLMQEFIDNVFLAKVTLWDNYFLTKIQYARKKEMGEMRLGGFTEGWSLSMVHIIPIVTVSVVTMAIMLSNQPILPANYIPCLVLILINLKSCIRNSWFAMSSISRGVISLNKLKTVLTLKDADRFTDKPIDKNLAVTVNHGHFTWERDKSASVQQPNSTQQNSQFYVENIDGQGGRFSTPKTIESLVDINFYVPKSKLVGICGSCGSGKTSLLLSLMGQLNSVSGHVTIDGTCSYVSQIPWLFDGTLKENILFGESLDSSWYYKTLRSCHLIDDMALLPGSDDTDLTTVNIALSVKQKIALARAVYTQRDINLLDNPLSDVEPAESREIFEKSVVQALGSKTVIMISDRVQFLNRCDTIYVMKEGKIVEQGSHEELLQWNREYTSLVNSYMKKNKRKYHRSGEQINTSMSQLLTTPGPRGILSSTSTGPSSILDTDEEMIAFDSSNDYESSIKTNIYPKAFSLRNNFYMKNIGGWYLSLSIILISICFSLPVASSPLLFVYIAQNAIKGTTYIVIILSAVMGSLIFWGVTLLGIYNEVFFAAAKKVHELWLQGLFRAQMCVFATISPSILMNICSLNLQEVDSVLPRLMTTVLMHTGICIFSVFTLAVLSFWLLIPIALFILVSLAYIAYANGLTRNLQEAINWDSVVPIYNHSANTIAGRAVIQAYHKEREFTKKFYRYCDNNSTFDFMLHAIKLWLEFRIKMLSAVTLGFAILVCASLSDIRDHYEIIGIAFICTLQLALSVVHLTGAFTSAYASLIAINAVDDYVQDLPKENYGYERLLGKWPEEHSIRFENVVLTSDSRHEPMNISIAQGEKVALIGIEPTLKSSFVTALYRFVEITSGIIYVGNKNIVDVSMDKLRKSVNFIPSDPVLFNGSIRYNLDPYNERTDKALVAALESVFLWEKVSRLSDKLASPANALFHLWERKLLFLARALLNNSSKIIIIEESVEHLGDEDIVENILCDVFADYTIIALSSRRVRYAQRTYSLDDGKIIELPNGRADSSQPSIIDLSISIPKTIIQTNF